MFASAFDREESGRLVGFLHDVGKIRPEFQRHIIENDETHIDHSIVGASELFKNKYILEALCVAGHHAGLPDIGSRFSTKESTFLNRYKNYESSPLLELATEYPEYKIVKEASLDNPSEIDARIEMYLRTKLLFSCLTDADYLDTESFMTQQTRISMFSSWDEIINHVDAKVNQLLVRPYNSEGLQNNIGITRNTILQEAINKGKGEKGIYSLSGPTGSGKTISSLAFACEQIRNNPELRRIIYVIPYTSIIEQTAEVIRKIVGSDNVLEHHSLTDYSLNGTLSYEQELIQRQATENWDMPIIVTTNVQFFESLFSDRPGKCRKLHNIAGSVIVFDEVQMLPLNYLLISIKAIESLVKNFNCSVLLCSATQPDFNQIAKIRKPIEIISDINHVFSQFRKNIICFIDEQLDFQSLADKLEAYKQVLCIFNYKEAVRKCADCMTGEYIYLTTNLTPYDRKIKIAEIHDRLNKDLPCVVLATSLVEAGVDFDFPVVFREINGLDSINQAAGRCNREGTRPFDESYVYIFHTSESIRPLDSELVRKVEMLKNLSDLNSFDSISLYYELIFDLRSMNNSLDLNNVYHEITNSSTGVGFMNFRTIAEKVKLISSNTEDVVVPIFGVNEDLIYRLGNSLMSKDDWRELGKFQIPLYQNKIIELKSYGIIKKVPNYERLWLLTDQNSYNADNYGLDIHPVDGRSIFI